jgi:hypothetical protein
MFQYRPCRLIVSRDLEFFYVNMLIAGFFG